MRYESGGFYYLDVEPYSVVCSSNVSPFDTHYRLGHLSLLNEEVSSHFESYIELRLSCVNWFSIGMSYPPMIHFDVWGSCLWSQILL